MSAPFVMSCPPAIWGARKEEQMGGDHLFYRSVGEATVASASGCVSWSFPEQKLPVPSYLQRVTKALCKHTLCKGMQVEETECWPASNVRPPQPCIASLTPVPSLYLHPPHTVKKPWASVSTSKAVLAAALEMEPDNFGYEWLVCSYGWNYCWWRRFAGSLAEWCHLRVVRAEGWEKSFLAVLCPCGETTSKRSRASHFWASPHTLFEKVPAATNCDGGFCAASTSNWNQGNLWDLVL